MKKVVFVINELATGGVPQSLINLINEIKDSYEVTLLVFYLREEEKRKIPNGINTIVLNSPYKHLGMSKADVKGKPLAFFVHAFWVYLTKFFGRSCVIRIMSLFQEKIKGFDCAVSFIHEANQHSLYGGCNEFALDKIVCNNHISWLHCDFESIGISKKQSEIIYNRFDKIVACSEGCRQSFLRVLPNMYNKCTVIKNCINYGEIGVKAGEGYQYDHEFFNVITVARLSEEKGLERALKAVDYCIGKGMKIKYHIVGDGNQKQRLMDLTKSLNLTKNVFFYGNQSNPFYYIKNADLFLLSSYHEAAPMVIYESAYLKVPILSTRTTSSDEMIIENNFGIVCENNSESLNRALLNTIQDKKKLESIKCSLSESKYSNDGVKYEISKLLQEK